MEETSTPSLPSVARSEICSLPVSSKVVPWLVYSHVKGKKRQTFHNLSEPNNKSFTKSIPEMSYKKFMQVPSHPEWLIITMNDEKNCKLSYINDNDDDDCFTRNLSKWKLGDIFLWNSLSYETILLPSLFHWFSQRDEYHLRDLLLSSTPGNSDSMVLVLFTGDENDIPGILLFCRPGDEKWRTKEVPGNTCPKGLACIKGKIYVRCVLSCWYSVEICDDESLCMKPINLLDDQANPFPFVVGTMPALERHYVQCCNEIFQVIKVYESGSRIIDIASMMIMKMNFSLMDWEEVKDLGDCVLFLGRETTTSCLASDLGLSRGCVYFTQSDDRNVYKFDPEKETITVTLPCPNLPRPWFSPEWLILPPSLREVDERNIRNTSSCREVEDMNNGQKEIKILKSGSDEEEDLEEIENFPIILSKEMLEIIEAYLQPMDYMRLRSTSKAAHSLMRKPNWQYADILPDTSLYPLLVFLTKYDGVFNFVDPMNMMNEKYLMNLSEFSDSDIHYSKGGWLLMSDGESIVLLNPFAGRKVFLPNLPTEGGDYVNFGYDFKGISFSSSPTSPDCIVFAIQDWNKHSVVIHYTKRGDDHWSHGVFNNSGLPTNERKSMGFKPRRLVPVFYDGRFYCLDSKGTLATFYLENGAHWRVLEKPKRPCNTIYQCFLVECDGNLLSVFVGHMGKWVRIFRLDFSAMAWVEVENLGKHMLFISYTSCVSAVAPVSRMANKVYFPRYNNGEGVLYYSLDTGLYHSFGDQQQLSFQDFYNTKEQLYSGWLEPNWSQYTHDELTWQIPL